MVKEENPVKPKEVSAHQKEVSINQKLNPSQNTVWRSFWLGVRELSTRETDRRCEEGGDQDDLASAFVTEDSSAPPMITGDKKRH